MNQNRIGQSKVKSDDHFSKRIAGLIRIDADILTIIETTESIKNKCEKKVNHNHFRDFQSVSIIYRKCFYVDKRGVELTEKHLKYVTIKQKALHLLLKELANTHVAHCGNNEYDNVNIFLIIDNVSGRAFDIDVYQYIFEPLKCNDFKEISDLMNIIRINIYNEITELKEKVIEKYNIEFKNKTLTEVQKKQRE